MNRYTIRRITAKTAAYTIKKDQPDITGSLFTNRGAVGSVTFTLPTPSSPIAGVWYEFQVLTAQSLIVAAASAGQIIAAGNIAADNVGFQVAGAKVGGVILAICDGTSWVCLGARPGGGFCVNGTEVSNVAGVTVNELAVLAGVTAGAAAASKAVVLDANKAVDANFLLKLGAAVTVQSPPIAGLVPDVAGAASGTVQNTFYPLSSITIPANALSANGKGIEFTFAATTAANANAKDFRLHFGTATPTLVTGSTASGKPVVVTGCIYRTAAGAQRVVAQITIDGTTATINTTATADETGAWTFSLESQNTAAAAASGTGTFGNVWFQN